MRTSKVICVWVADSADKVKMQRGNMGWLYFFGNDRLGIKKRDRVLSPYKCEYASCTSSGEKERSGSGFYKKSGVT